MENIIAIPAPAPAAVMAQTRREITANRRYIPVSLMENAAQILREWADNLQATDERKDDFFDAVRGTVEPHETDDFQAVYLCGVAQGAIERGEPLDGNLAHVRDAMRQFAQDVMDSGHVPYTRLERYVAENFCSVLAYALMGGEKFAEF